MANLPIHDQAYRDGVALSGKMLEDACHGQSAEMGWWDDLKDVLAVEGLTEAQRKKITMWYQATKLMLSVSELAEGMEGLRKGKMDDHLPHLKMIGAELADSVIRDFDLSGAMGLDLGEIIAEKLHYNAGRPDHQREAREAEGGKKF